MAETAIYRYRVNLLNSEAINFKTVVSNPRIYKPQDLHAASGNVEIVSLQGEDPNPFVECLVEYVVTEFFSMAHRTGLYNRQKVLWESMSKITDVEIFQHTKGIFRKTPLPIFDLNFLDHKKKILIISRLVQPDAGISDKVLQRLLKDLIHKASRTELPVGLFFCAGEPFPASICRQVAKMTNADDPVGKYESLLPAPHSIPLDLLAMGTPTAGEGEAAKLSVQSIRLAHPDLTVCRRAHAAFVEDPKVE
jgi:hypothetical protein